MLTLPGKWFNAYFPGVFILMRQAVVKEGQMNNRSKKSGINFKIDVHRIIQF